MALEDWFGKNGGTIPVTIEDVVRKDEKEIDGRIKMLKLADKALWEAVENYVMEPLCDNNEDDRKWKREKEEAKENQESRKKKSSWRGQSGFRGGSYERDGYGGYYGGSHRGGFGGFRRLAVSNYSGGKRFWDQGRYVRKGMEDEEESYDSGKKTELVTESIGKYRKGGGVIR